MRMGFGLVALLITIAIMFYLFTNDASQAVKTEEVVKPEVQQIAGVADDGTPVENTYDLTPQTQADGRLHSLRVTRLAPDSPLASFFGLKLNDDIISAEYQSVDWAVNEAQDVESAKLSVREAFTHSGRLTVMRNGQQLTLPGAVTAAAPATPAATPAAPGQPQAPAAPAASDENDPMKAINDRLHTYQGN